MFSSVTTTAAQVSSLASCSFEAATEKAFAVPPTHILVGQCTLTVAERPRELDDKSSTKRAAGSKRQGGSKRALIGGQLHVNGAKVPFYFYFKLIGKKTFSNAGHVEKYARCNYVRHVQRFTDFSFITIFTSPGVEKNSREIGIRKPVEDKDKQAHPPLVLSTGHDVARVQLHFYVERHDHQVQSKLMNHMVEFHSIYSEMAQIVFGIDKPSTQVRNQLTVQSTQSIREDWIRTVEEALKIGSRICRLPTVLEEDEKHTDLQCDTSLSTSSSASSAMSSSLSSSCDSMSAASSPNSPYPYTTPSSYSSSLLSSLKDSMSDATPFSDTDSSPGTGLYTHEETHVDADNFCVHTLPGTEVESFDQLPLPEFRAKPSSLIHEDTSLDSHHSHRKRKMSESDDSHLEEKEYTEEYEEYYKPSDSKRYKPSSASPPSPSSLAMITPLGSVESAFQHPHSMYASSPPRDYEEEETSSDVDTNEEPFRGTSFLTHKESTLQVHGSPVQRSSWFNSPLLTINVPTFSRSHSRSSVFDDSQPNYTMSPLILEDS